MRIGIVSFWFNRGQGTVSRLLRSLFDSLGHETFILARPPRETFSRKGIIERSDVWNQPGVTHASTNLIPLDEYLRWTGDNGIDTAFFDQNYQFGEIAAIRASGVTTIGRFVWESFAAKHVAGALQALDVVYSLTRCEHQRYLTLGIRSPLLRWTCAPELMATPIVRAERPIRFLFPGGYLSDRKPTAAVIEAFRRCPAQHVELVIKTQHPTRGPVLERELADGDPRITVITDDLSNDAYLRLIGSCHVCLAPSRWEGLGLHLYEATAFGMPIITNDNPPMNEIVRNDDNGALVRSQWIGQTPSGIDSFDPDIDDLTAAITAACESSTLERWQAGAMRRRDELPWTHTIADFQRLLQQVSSAASVGASR